MLFRSDTATTEIYTGEYTLSLHDALPIFSVAAKIGFKPFDFSRAGLCGHKVQPIYDTSYDRQLDQENR